VHDCNPRVIPVESSFDLAELGLLGEGVVGEEHVSAFIPPEALS
jgi:hypothetical protein